MNNSINTPILSTQGNANISGINIDISTILGQEIVKSFISQLDGEYLDCLYDELKNDIWSKKIENHPVKIKKIRGYYNDKEEDVPFVKTIKTIFNNEVVANVKEEIEKYFKTDEYKQKAEEAAKEVIEYAIDGWKKEMIDTLRERMLLNLFAAPGKEETDIQSIVNETLFRERNYNN